MILFIPREALICLSGFQLPFMKEPIKVAEEETIVDEKAKWAGKLNTFIYLNSLVSIKNPCRKKRSSVQDCQRNQEIIN